MKPLFEAIELTKHYAERPVVRSASFSIYPGEVVALLGPNGAGKTTTFHLCMGFIQPDSGKLFLEQTPLASKSVDARARLGMGYLAQEPSIFGALTVKQNLLCVLELLPLTKTERQLRLVHTLKEFHLTELADKKASSLSGGERRRLEVSRSLLREPKLLLLDEPFANIDPLMIEELKRLIQYLKQRGIAVLITDHNARETLSISDRVYLMRDGKIFLSGTREEILYHPLARSHYLGDSFDA